MKPFTNEILPQGYKMTELGALPEEWEVVKALDYCNFDRGTEPGSESYNREGEGVIFIRVGNISAGIQELLYTKSDNIKLCNEEDILMSFDGSPGIVIKGFKGAYSSGIRKVTPKMLNLNKNFLFYILKTKYVQDVIEKYKTGVTIKHASTSLQHIKLPLPPLLEQQKIAAVLSAVQEAKEKTEAVIAAAKALKKSMMKHLFTYGPVSPEEAENIQLKETEIGPVPEDWEVVRLGEVAEISSGGTPSRKRNEYWIDGNIPWIKSEQCHDCYISVANEYITDLGLEDSSAKMLKKGTVLLAMVGATIGKTGFLTFEACTNQNIAGIFPINSLNNLFLYYALQSRYNEFEKIKGYGIANLSYLRQFKIPLPPLPIQQKIASILSAIDAKIEAEENKKKALEELFKSLLHNLMTAKIRVNKLEVSS